MNLIEITLNGKTISVAQGQNLQALLLKLDYLDKKIAVELDGEVVSKSCWDSKQILAGAVVEVVQAIGGG